MRLLAVEVVEVVGSSRIVAEEEVEVENEL
jgi:hypothetical protein